MESVSPYTTLAGCHGASLIHTCTNVCVYVCIHELCMTTSTRREMMGHAKERTTHGWSAACTARRSVALPVETMASASSAMGMRPEKEAEA